MSTTQVYINAQECISPQATFANTHFLEDSVQLDQRPRRSIEPNYKEFIGSRYLRRMGRMVRMGVCTAKKVLHDAGVENPDAILVGTGLGCLKDTEAFLTSIYESDENIASPNQFIQSTHNNVAAQIAIMLGCYNYNFTYVHRGFSFESALLDAMMHVLEAESESCNILVGASDELTDLYVEITNKLSFFNGDFPAADSIWTQNQHIAQGEGAAFFSLSNVAGPNVLARLEGLHMLYKPASADSIQRELDQFLLQQKLERTDVDLILVGFSGRKGQADPFVEIFQNGFEGSRLAAFKHLCGEYKTASAFATWLSIRILKEQMVPDFIKLTDFQGDKINRVLICNNYNNTNFTFSLLSHV